MILSLIVFLFVLGTLVFVHELGHFLVAKFVGMRVDEFGLGFPPHVFTKRKGETLYAINAIPLGGYVKIHGESSHGADEEPRSFQSKSVPARIAVIVAGVTMNILFAFIVLSIAFSIGFPAGGLGIESIPGAVIQKSEVIVAATQAGSAAERSGFKAGESIRQFTDQLTGEVVPVTSLNQMVAYTKSQQETGHLNLQAELFDGKNTRAVPITISQQGPALGASIQEANQVRVPFYRAPEAATKAIYYISASTWDALKGFGVGLFAHGKLDSTVSGPVGIYRVTSTAAHEGVIPVVFLMVALSVNLALLNIMPIPALDGGKLVFLVIELIFRKRVVSEKIENAFSSFGFFALIGLIAVITLRDLGLF